MPQPPGQNALPLPLRITVKGVSNVCVKSAAPDELAAFTFPRALEKHLLSRGRPNAVTALAIPGDLTRWMLRDWVRDYLASAPDVIVLFAGHYEMVHLVWPRWLERHAHSLTWRPGPIRTRYQRIFMRKTWSILGKIQREIDRRMPMRVTSRRLRRIAADVAALIERIRRFEDPLIIVMEIPTPGARARSWFPGMTPRARIMNQLFAEVVAQADSPNVRYFTTNAVIERETHGDPDSAILDGFHLTPTLHDAVGAELAGIVDEWAATRPELK